MLVAGTDAVPDDVSWDSLAGWLLGKMSGEGSKSVVARVNTVLANAGIEPPATKMLKAKKAVGVILGKDR